MHLLEAQPAVELPLGDLASGRREPLGDDHEVARFLQLDHEAAAADRVRHAAVDEDEVPRLDGHAVQHVDDAPLCLERLLPLLLRDPGLEAEVDAGVGGRAVEEVPAFRLADRGIELRAGVGDRWMGLHDEALVRIKQLDEDRQRADDVLHQTSVDKGAESFALDLERPVERRRRGGHPVLRARHPVRAVWREACECVDASTAEIGAADTIGLQFRDHDVRASEKISSRSSVLDLVLRMNPPGCAKSV